MKLDLKSIFNNGEGNLLENYTINLHSVRNFDEAIIDKNFTCKNSEITELLHDMVNDTGLGLELVLREPITVNSDNIILDGNLRYHLLKQLYKMSIKGEIDITGCDLLIVCEDASTYFKQLTGVSSVSIPIRDKMRILDDYIQSEIKAKQLNEKSIRKVIKAEYGNTIYAYACMVARYKTIPEWLKKEADRYHIHPRVVIKYFSDHGSNAKLWRKVKSVALERSTGGFKITERDITKALVSSDKTVYAANYDDAEHASTRCVEVLNEIKKTLPSFDINAYHGDKERLLEVLETFLYALYSASRIST